MTDPKKPTPSKGSKKFFLVAFLVLMLASIFMGYKQGIQSPYYADFPGDAVDYNNVLHTAGEYGDTYINPAKHSFLVKMPIFYLQNFIGFSEAAFLVFGIIIAVVTNLAIAWFIYMLSERNKLASGIGFMLLASVTVMPNVSIYYSPESWVTLRNLEIPMTLIVIVAMLRLKKILSFKSLLLILFTSLLFASDHLMLYLLIVSTPIFLVFDYIRHKSGFWQRNRVTILFVSVVTAVVPLWYFASQTLGLYSFPTYPGVATIASNPLESVLNTIVSLFYVFNSSIFSGELDSWQVVIAGFNALIALASIAAVGSVIKRFIGSKRLLSGDRFSDRSMLFLACYTVGALLFYQIIADVVSWRYLIFVRSIGIISIVFCLAIYWKKISLFLNNYVFKRKVLSKIIFSIITISIFFAEFIVASQIYSGMKTFGDSQKEYYTAIATELEKQEVDVLLGYFNDAQMAKFIYDQGKPKNKELKINQLSINCNFNLQETKYSWHLADGSHVAVMPRFKLCSKEIRDTYGEPSRIVYIQGETTKPMWIYDYDIRAKYDLRRLDSVEKFD